MLQIKEIHQLDSIKSLDSETVGFLSGIQDFGIQTFDSRAKTAAL